MKRKTSTSYSLILALILVLVAGVHTASASLGLQATSGDSKVILEWDQDSGIGFLGYNIYRNTEPDQVNTKPINSEPVTGRTYVDENVQNGVTYYYHVKSVFFDYAGDSSREIAITPGKADTNTTTDRIVLQVGNKNMTVNGVQKEIYPGSATAPVIIEKKTMVPIRAIIEALGGTVNWDQKQQKVTVMLNGSFIELWINKTEARVDGVKKTTDIGPKIVNGRTLLPLRFVAENLGCNVDWEGSTQTITITRK